MHDHDLRGVNPDVTRAVWIAVAVCALLTVVGLVAWWPRRDAPPAFGDFTAAQIVKATATEVAIVPCAGTEPGDGIDCRRVTAKVTSGPTTGEETVFELPTVGSSPRIDAGDRITLGYNADAEPAFRYAFADFQRSTPLILLTLLFAGSVLLLGRWKGLGALGGLAASLVVLITFLLPSLLEGNPAIGVAVVGAAAVAFIALFLAHGFNVGSAVALLGTLASLLIVVVLAQAFTSLTHLTGLIDEDALRLDLTSSSLDLRAVLVAGMVIGALGVLDDVTVTQVSAVWELRESNPTLGVRRLYDAGVRIGRDHISSTVNTLVLAYAGASLPLLLLFTQAERKITDIAAGEVVAVEIVRALVGSIGLVASVPITTLLAAVVAAGGHHRRGGRPAGAPSRTNPSPGG